MKAVGTDFEQARQRARWLTMTLGVLGLGTYLGPVSYTHLTLPTNREV